MSSAGRTVTVDTAEKDELDESAPGVEIVAEDSNKVTVDTIQSDLDRLVESAPAPAPAHAHAAHAALARKRSPSPQAPQAQAQRKPSPKHRRSPAPAPAPAAAQPVRKMLDGQSAFMDALRTTIPRKPEATPAEEEEEQDAPPAEGGPVPEGEEEDSEDDEGTEEEETSSADASDSDDDGLGDDMHERNPELCTPRKKKAAAAAAHSGYAADPKGAAAAVEEDEDEPEGEEEEDEDATKMRLLEESATMMSDGFLPIQQPTFSMSVETLKKIVAAQENQAAEQFGVGLIGFGWVEIIRLLETANRAFDPAAKVLGPGKSLRLDGATDAVAKNIRRYRGPFRYLWKKMQSKKLEEYSPLITMGLVTYDILKHVHQENLRAELRHNAAESMRPTPASMAAAQRYAQAAAGTGQKAAAPSYRTPSEAPAQALGHQAMMPGEQTPPASAAAAQEPMMPTPSASATTASSASYEGTYAAASTAADGGSRMIPVDQIVIPESDDEAAPAAADDDDDVVVAVPAPSGAGGRRGGRGGVRRRR